MPQQTDPRVFFPVETTGRELSAHILLGTRLASRGVCAVVGHLGPVKRLVQSSPTTGIVFYKGDARLNLFGRSDFSYIGQDPETGITLKHFADHVARRPKIFQNLDTTSAYFAFGDHDYSFLTTHFPHLQHKIHRTGTPRATLWGPLGHQFYQDDVAAIHTQYGEFCLAVSRGGRSDRHDRHQNADRRTQVEITAANLLRKAQELREATGLPVVIRPHPSESWRGWKRAVRDAAGIFVETCFDLSAWIRAAQVVVQAPTSTASFEAWLAKTPAIISEPPEPHVGKDGSRAEFVAHELCVSHSVWSPTFDFAAMLREYEELRTSSKANSLVREKLYLAGSDVTVLMAEVIETLIDETRSSTIRAAARVSAIERFRMHSLARTLHQERLGRRMSPPHKRWALSPKRIDLLVRRAGRIIGVGDEVKASWLMPNCFVIERK